MTIDEDTDTKPAAVEVVLPDDSSVTEVALDDKPDIREPEAKVTSAEEQPAVDPREAQLLEMKKLYESQRRAAEDAKRRAEAEREARKRAEQFAREQAQNVQYAQNNVQQADLRIITNAIEATEAAAEHAERTYSDAMAAGDYALAAKAQRAMAKAEADLLQLNNGRARLEESLQQPVEGRVDGPQIPSFEPQIAPDPVEMYAERLSPKSAAWLRAHPDAVHKINRLTRAHQDAVEDGIVAESPEYFEFIESRLGIAAAPAASHDEPAQELPRSAAPTKKSVASAPVSSSTTSINPRSSADPNVMRLSADEVEMAVMAEPDLPREKAIAAYAQNKAYMIKAGRM